MTSQFIHENEQIFADAHAFRPERWLGAGGKNLQRYLVPFSRGTRACVGINLAWAEMYLTIASLFRRFDFDVSGVVRSRDIDFVRDCIISAPSKESKGVVVSVLPVRN